MPAKLRGQATVEMALGVLVFITVLITGIHFAEVGYLSIRVQEAATSPLWDATALRVHTMDDGAQPARVGDFGAFPAIPDRIERDAVRRYEDFDGRRSSRNAGEVRHLFTRLHDPQIFCRRDDRIFFDLPRGGGPSLKRAVAGGFSQGRPGSGGHRGGNHSVLGRVYENVGGLSCTAGARLSGYNLPQRFMEGASGFFTERPPRAVTLRVCASGRAVGGTCPGRYGLLLGDWGFAGVQESGHCPLQPDMPDQPCSENTAFYNAARYTFDDNEGWGGREASDFALRFTGADPMPDQGFFMSYRGIEDGYVEQDTPPGEPDDMAYRPYNTGGVSHRPRAIRGECFLGRDGC